MKKFPLEKQDETKDCGVSCLSMIIRYYNGYFPKEDLREMTKTSRLGTTAYHLTQTLKEIGFDSYGVECDFSNFELEDIHLPCIANVIINNSFKHFVVIYDINFKKKYLIIGDPADKIKKVKFEYFNTIYNNVLIFAKPNKTIPIINDRDYSFIWDILKKHRKVIINMIITSIILTICSIILSVYFGIMIRYLNVFSSKKLFIIFVIFLSTNTFKIIVSYIRNKLLIKMNTDIDYDLTSNVFQKIIMLPYRYYKNRTTGDMISRINDLSVIRDIISKAFLSLFLDLPLAIVSLIILFIIDYKLALITLIMVMLYLGIMFIFKSSYRYNINEVQDKRAISNSYMVETINGFETVKGIHLEKIINSKFRLKYYQFINQMRKMYHNYYLQNTLKELISDYGVMTIIYVGCILIINHSLALEYLIIFNTLLSFFLEPFKSLLETSYSLNEGRNSLRRITKIMIKNEQDGLILGNFNGLIKYNHLNYSFNDRDLILKDICLEIKNKEKVVIIGESGSGKSTLLKLLMKYYKVNHNELLINDVDINNISLDSISSIAYINQKEILFNDTLYNNINLNNNDELFLKVVKICHIDSIISSDLGYNMVIEENGFNMSGGEIQRIVLARTLMTKFDILIIDEGLNQVDINLERDILKQLFKQFSDKTIIVISHRMDNVDLFEHLIEMKNGIIIKNIMKRT